MPSTSKAQQRLMGMAYSLKKGEMDPKDASQEVKDLADSMTLQQLKDFASTKHDDLPEKADEGISPANIGGMGATLLPTSTQPGSGDVLSGAGDAEEEAEKKKKERRDFVAKVKKFKTFEQFINESTDSPVNTFAKDEQQEGYDAKVFLGNFDGRSFKAQVCTKLWPDGVPVTKHFSKFQDVKLKGEFQLVDSDRGWWYIQGPKGAWYAVKHADYGTPPFEY